MARRFGALYYASGIGYGLDHVRLEEHAKARIRDTAELGPVIYLLPRRSSLDHLALNAALTRSGLPLSAWAPQIRTGWTHPLWSRGLGSWLRGLGRSGLDPVASGWLRRALAAGHAITLFRGASSRRAAPPNEVLEALTEPVDGCAVRVLPVEIVWNRAPLGSTRMARFVQGTAEQPGVLRRIWRLWRGADAFVQVSEAIDLSILGERVAPERLGEVLQRIAARSSYRESKLVRGPRLLAHRVMKRRVLRSKTVVRLTEQVAQEEGQPQSRIARRLSVQYDRIAANFSWTIITLLHVVLQPLWTWVFSGVDVRDEDLERIRTAMRDGTPILIPCHKSHFDYVLLSWVLFDHDMIVPHVVAGMNLAVWPISIFLRGAGGLFIKRRFAGDPTFPTLFSRYLRELIAREYPVEFFIEGGRTRSGKLLTPRLGVLGMVMDASAVRRKGREVTLLPMAFAYEQVAEERAYLKERRGRDKRPETLRGIITASTVLRRRFGRVYLRVGEPIRCGPLVDAEGDTPWWRDRSPEAQRDLLKTVGQRVVHRIGTVVVQLPTSLVAMALLAHHRRALRHDELIARVRRLASLLDQLDAPRAASLERFDQAVSSALDRFLRSGWIEALEHEGERIWSVPPEARLSLDFHKNQLLHYLAPAGVVVCALRGGALGADPTPGVRLLVPLWSREFVWNPDVDADAIAAQGLRDLVRHGAIERDEQGVVQAEDPALAGEIHGLFVPLLEAYRTALQPGRLSSAAKPKELAAQLLEKQVDLLGRGEITRPEALSLETLTNAMSSLDDAGLLHRDEQGRLSVDEAAVGGHIQQMDKMLGRSA
ncbi:MAG: 1-acyl-sn-glycerol-3-phosphate acyltransferase [Myxococcales bacterium]|nr:1-acyl-sn-glycerol-3-phosphate acyltransferase [Myxococcales bacterium]